MPFSELDEKYRRLDLDKSGTQDSPRISHAFTSVFSRRFSIFLRRSLPPLSSAALWCLP